MKTVNGIIKKELLEKFDGIEEEVIGLGKHEEYTRLIEELRLEPMSKSTTGDNYGESKNG